MKRVQSVLVPILLVLHVMGWAGVTSDRHSHLAAQTFSTRDELRSHDCGPVEVHKPIEESGTCLPCTRSWTNSLADSRSGRTGLSVEFDQFFPPDSPPDTRDVVHPSARHRGPPLHSFSL